LPGQGLPGEWVHYRPSWVEWSITAAGFAGFLLIYTLVVKLFPIISIWETRAEGPATAEPAAPASAPGWKPIPSILGSLILGVFFLDGVPLQARAAAEPKQPQPTDLSVEWQTVEPDDALQVSAEATTAEALEPRRTYLFPERLFSRLGFGSERVEEKKPLRGIAVIATLRDASGLPLSYQAVAFSLRTSFGVLRYGSRPTDDAGKARLVVRDRRFGQYPVEVRYEGNDAHTASRTEVLVDFDPRPPPNLPHEGVLITPYPTAALGLPFLVFYGTIWVVFFYAFGYLVLWRMWWREGKQRPS